MVSTVIILIQHIDAVFTALWQGHTIHTLGKRHKRKAHTLYFHNGIAATVFKVLLRGISAKGFHACGPDSADGSSKTGNAVIDRIGVCQLHQIDTRFIHCGQQLGRGGAILRTVGRTDEVALQVHHGHIRIT